MLVSGIFGRKNIHGIELALEFPDEIFAGTDAPVMVGLINKRRFMPAFLVKVLIEEHEILFPFLPASSRDMRHLNMRFDKRGRREISRVYVSSVFPFNFFTRFRRMNRDIQLVVFPRPLRCPLHDTQPRQMKSKGETPSNSIGFDSDVISIRDYVTGDPPKYIAWKSTAKTGLLKTKEHSSIRTRHVMIDFEKMDKTNLEYTLSCVTFAILRLIKSSTPVGLAIDGEVHKPSTSSAQKARMLTKLALYGQN